MKDNMRKIFLFIVLHAKPHTMKKNLRSSFNNVCEYIEKGDIFQ